MPTNYDGDSANISSASRLSISSSTNTNPITIFTSSPLPADFLTGVEVDVYGHQVNTSANGVWRATVTGASSFTIPVAGVGVGGGTGNVQPLNLTPFYQIPSDGDLDNEASIDSWAKSTGDRTQFMAARLGIYKIAGRVVLQNAFGPNRQAMSIAAASLTAGTWNQLTCQNSLTVLGEEEGVLSPAQLGTGGQPTLYSVDNFNAFDIVSIEMDYVGTSSDSGYFGLWWASTLPGAAAPTWPGSFALIPGTTRLVESSAPCYYHGRGLLPHFVTGRLSLVPAFYALNSATYSVAVNDDLQLITDALRITGLPE